MKYVHWQGAVLEVAILKPIDNLLDMTIVVMEDDARQGVLGWEKHTME